MTEPVTLPADFTTRLFTTAAERIIAAADELTQLDSAIGDADHGLNMKRGFEAILAELPKLKDQPVAEALKGAGMQLVMKVGGASGPLYGTLLMTLGKELGTAPTRAAAARALAEAVKAVAARGKSETGQKTMLDVLVPVSEAVTTGHSASEIRALTRASAEATVPMLAIRGRASFLGERSIGHMDPGSRSSQILIESVIDVLETV
jgi:dihydroxyacetone kinase-like protein